MFASVRARPYKTLLVAVLALASVETVARADVNACLSSYESGQRVRKQGKLLEARRTLQGCMREGCPASVRKDCSTWFEEISQEIPSISVKAQGRDGCDRSNVTYSIDQTTRDQRADGLLVELDPGPHVLRARIDDRDVEQPIVVATRERGRIVTLAYDPSATRCGAVASSGPPAASPVTPAGEKDVARPLSPLAIALAGTGVVALGAGAFFTVRGFDQKSGLDECRGACAQGDVDAMNRSFLIGDVCLGVGVAALVVAAIVHFTR